jgi:exosome complex component RRP40
LGDIVLGVIVGKTADNYKVDIAAPSQAILSNIAFNSASKRHRPNLKVGHAILCQVIAADLRFEIELSCEDPTTQKDWVTNEVYFGGLPEGGLLISVPKSLSARLSDPEGSLVPIVARNLKPFELSIGVNGRIYIRTNEGEYLRAVLVGKALRAADSMNETELETFCAELAVELSHSV